MKFRIPGVLTSKTSRSVACFLVLEENQRRELGVRFVDGSGAVLDVGVGTAWAEWDNAKFNPCREDDPAWAKVWSEP